MRSLKTAEPKIFLYFYIPRMIIQGMKRSILFFTIFILGLLLSIVSCRDKDTASILTTAEDEIETPFDSILIAAFFKQHPKLKNFQADVIALYQKQQYRFIWFDENGINEIGNLLYNKISNLEEEGIQATIPYKNTLDDLFQASNEEQIPNVDDELLISSLYFFYADKVYKGLDNEKIKELGWYLPQKKQSYINYLDSLISNPSLINKDEKEVLGQYYRLREVLKQYREIDQKNKWDSIALASDKKSLKPGDSAQTIVQIRKWLFMTGDIKTNSKSPLYDTELEDGILNFKKRHAFAPEKTILPKHITAMNVPISQRIKTILANMERCRWISTDLSKAKEYIVINIPSYQLTYFKNDKPVLRSKVVVGKAINKTVVFSAYMKYIVFSPYWNVPKSILNKEILPALEKNPNYLAENDMEWYKGDLRQRPGPKNSLGLIKFLFPNSNSIYLHDTPSKNLFNEEKRAFSHGCIRIEKPVELANLILEDDKKWTPEKITLAMNKGEESWHSLKNKIPVYIGYFTTWVDSEGTVHFYDDIYKRDERLAAMLLEE